MYMFALICPRNSVTKEDLLSRFSDQESLAVRLQLMEKNVFVRAIGSNEVELLAKGRFLARAILMARLVFGA